jgi:hypothetical protein
VTSDGSLRFGLVVQFVQTRSLEVEGIDRAVPTGMTLVIDVTGLVRFVIACPDVETRKTEMERMARLATTTPLGWTLGDPSADPFAVDYRGMHEART